MKINEILPVNDLWLQLSNNSLDITDRYNEIVWLLDFLIQQKSKYRNNNWLPSIEEFEDLIYKLLTAEFPDETDPDVITFKKTATEMLKTIKQLKSQLVL